MAWDIPDKGEGADDLQSVVHMEYMKAIVNAFTGDFVLSGCALSSNSNMTIACAKGAIVSNKVMKAVTAANFTVGTADGTNPRIDLLVIDSTGAKQVRAGTAAAFPKPPVITANDVLLGVVFVPANDTNLATDQIVDLRIIRGAAPILIWRNTTATTTNTTAAAIELLNKAGSGLVIPNGLLLTGRKLRVHIAGNLLMNNGTPTVRIAIAFGGTTMFSDISAASTGDADRAAFSLDFEIHAQANNDQALTGMVTMGQIAAKTAPTTGIGDAWSTAYNVAAVAGAAAVDADAADRTLSVQLTFSVSNAANEVVVESETVELL